MAWAEVDRVQIRMYLGASSMWLQSDSRLESAITNSQAVSDGGTRPDNSTELAMRGVIGSLQIVDKQLVALANQQGATAVSTTKLDAAREGARLKGEGRMWVHRLARFLDTFPYADIYGAAPSRATGYPNWPGSGHNPYSG